jgi:ribosomal protein S18 acetylase RimI-like enzyme
MITVRRARPTDAPGIAAVHVAAWRSTYPTILPTDFLARLSPLRQTMYYDRAIRNDVGVHVALSQAGIVGFATCERALRTRLAEGEIETLYVLDDWRDQGIGRRLLRASAELLDAGGCRSVFLWVLRDNPSRWFYLRLGGRAVAESTIRVGGASVIQTAFVWDPIDLLLQSSRQATEE